MDRSGKRFSPVFQHLIVAVGIVIFVPLVTNMFMRHITENSIIFPEDELLMKSSQKDAVSQSNIFPGELQSHSANYAALQFDEYTSDRDGAPLRFLQSSTKNRRVYGSNGPGAIFWLQGLLNVDFPFACKCDPTYLSDFVRDNTSSKPTKSTVRCAATGSASGIFSKDAMCDATNGSGGISWIPSIFVVIIGNFLLLSSFI